ncbi:MAG: hypothetical protein ETSY2_44600 [Candidatus Entotheonella gemina]|uniref:Uncharacterized protein n=1 Tax=Candidatus Entotheonella gemina TaxID=1429439 RepID=W4LHJ2_9BACT|nr:MAG: hypothetical protein ETSY2_44600 [Candidatus Entotheonella gemina]
MLNCFYVNIPDWDFQRTRKNVDIFIRFFLYQLIHFTMPIVIIKSNN